MMQETVYYFSVEYLQYVMLGVILNNVLLI